MKIVTVCLVFIVTMLCCLKKLIFFMLILMVFMYIWLQARPLFRDRRRFSEMIDPLLEGQYPVRGLYQALAIAAMCVQEQPNMRPVIADVVTALNYLASQKYDPQIHHIQGSRKGSSSPRSRTERHRRVTSKDSETDRLGD
jgi:hypothetical protein